MVGIHSIRTTYLPMSYLQHRMQSIASWPGSMDEQVVFSPFLSGGRRGSIFFNVQNSNIPGFAQLNLFEAGSSFCECTIILRSYTTTL